MRAWVAMLAGIALLIALWLRSGGDPQPQPTARGTAQRASAAKRAAPLATVSGRVTRASDGTGIASATVTFANHASSVVPIPPIAIATDRDGAWSTPVPAGDYAVATTAEGFVPQIIEHVAIAAGAQMDAALVAGGWLVSGIVTDLGGGPVANARIAFEIYTRGVIVATTRPDGRYRVTLPDGGCSVTASHDDYAAHRTAIDVEGAPQTLDFALVPGSTIRGRVIARDTGEPVADALVEMRDQLGDTEAVTALTDDHGGFVLAPIGSGAIALTARGHRYATGIPTIVEVGIGERADEVRIVADRAFGMSGRVLDGAGRPVAGVELYANLHADGRWQFEPREPTDADGAFEIGGLLPGRYTLYAKHDHATAERDNAWIVDADLVGVVLELGPAGAMLAGRVDPPTIATVLLDDSDPQTTGADGKFAFPHASPGGHSVQATTTDLRTGSLRVTIGAIDRSDAVVPLAVGGSIAGRVVDDAGAPVAGAYVMAFVQSRDGNPAGDRRAVADASGRFELAGLPDGRAALFASIVQGSLGRGRQQTVELVAGARRTEIVLAVERATLEIRGEVLDAAGAPIGDAWVTANRIAKTSYDETPPIATRQDGGFVLDHLAAGKYFIQARSARGNARGETTVTTGEHATIRLAPLGAIAIRVTLGDAPVTAYDLRCEGYPVYDRHVVASDGAHLLDHLDPHRYTCHAVSDAGSAMGTVEVASGTVPLELRMLREASVAGTVLNALTGAPLAGVEVTVQDTSDMGGDIAITGADGHFVLAHVPASGSVTFKAVPHHGVLAFVHFTAAEGQRVELGTLRLAPPKVSNASLGLNVDVSDGEVYGVTWGGPAEHAGIVRGDTIVSIDGIPVASFAPYAAYFTLESGLDVGQTVMLGLARGETVSVTAIAH